MVGSVDRVREKGGKVSNCKVERGNLGSCGKNLAELKEKNSPSAIENGEFMTDVLLSWIEKEFDEPPMADFRANPLRATVQKTKVRAVLNMSSLKGLSFNNAIQGGGELKPCN